MWGGTATLVPDLKSTPAMWRLHNDVRTAPGHSARLQRSSLQPPSPPLIHLQSTY
jgi:hypothetical protein